MAFSSGQWDSFSGSSLFFQVCSFCLRLLEILFCDF